MPDGWEVHAAFKIGYAMGINYIDLLGIRETVERKAQSYPIQEEAAEQPKAS